MAAGAAVCSPSCPSRLPCPPCLPCLPCPFDHVVAATERRLSTCAKVINETPRILRSLAFMPGVVHHHDRRAIAGPETLDLEQRERAGGIGFARLDVELVHQAFGDPFGAVQRA